MLASDGFVVKFKRRILLLYPVLIPAHMNTLPTRTILIICIYILASYASSYGQSNKKLKVYTANISTLQGERIKGVLDEVRDSSLFVLTANQRTKIPASAIQDIKIKRKGAVGRGALLGGLTGFGLGAILGLADGDEECPPGPWTCTSTLSAEGKALGMGIVFGVGGAVTGLIVGSLSRRQLVTINGDQGSFKGNLETMKKYAIQSNLK